MSHSQYPQHQRRMRVLPAIMVAALIALGISVAFSSAGASSAAAPTSRPAIAYMDVPPGAAAAQTQAYLSTSAGTAPVQLTSNLNQPVSTVSLSADGSFAITSNQMDSTLNNYDLFRVDTTTKDSTDITHETGEELYPQISPDMKRVAFLGINTPQNPGALAIQVLDLASGAITTISSTDDAVDGHPDAFPFWSHDGTKVAYESSVTTGRTENLVVAAADGTSRTVVLSLPAHANFQSCAWTPDDVYLICTRPVDFQLIAINMTTGTRTQITNDPTLQFWFPQITNDWVMYFHTYTLNDHVGRPSKMWLGDLSTIQSVDGVALGGAELSPASSGPVLPAPVGFPPGVTPPPPTTAPPTTPPPSSLPVSPPPTKPPGYRCGTVKFFGVRGSGETIIQGEGFGPTIDDVKKRLAKAIPGMRSEFIDYPAIPVDIPDPAYPGNYTLSEFQGRDTLLRAVRDFIQYCPHKYAIIAGYSQGADAAGDAYGLLTDSERKHVAELLMFGDPKFNPKQLIVDRGDFDALRGAEVVLLGDSPRVIPKPWFSRDESYCAKGDPVCNYKKANLPSCLPIVMGLLCPHTHYLQNGITTTAVQGVIDHLNLLPPLK